MSSLRSVLIAPDSFKGSLGAAEVAAAIARGWLSVRPDDHVTQLPQADGGEGTLDAIEAAVPGAQRHSAGMVTGPDGRPTPGEWLELPGGTAVVELAQASGLPLMTELDAGGSTTRGLGEVIRAALDAGATSLLIGLGGSASTDAGTGALAALGLRLLDANGERLPDGGARLTRLARVDRSDLLPPPSGGVILLTDVTAPLLGPTGAAAVFGPQKGATPADVENLELALATVAAHLGLDPAGSGLGAAGGTAYGFVAEWAAHVVSGADHIAELSGLDERIADSDVMITGEGRFDEQSLTGKVVGQILGRAARHGVATVVIAGAVQTSAPGRSESLTELAGSPEAAMAETARWLEVAGANAARAAG